MPSFTTYARLDRIAAVRALAVLWLAGAGAAALCSGQTPANAADADKKLATLAGAVIGGSGPVANANVLLSQVYTPGAPGIATRISAPGVARTDAAGNFSFERLAPGPYMLRVNHPAYVPAVYGAPAGLYSSGGTVLTLTEGQHMTGITVRLIEPGTVTGRVVDEDGDPLAHAKVEVLRRIHYNGRPQVADAAVDNSADDGSFKVTGVPPGRYYFRVAGQPSWSGSERAPVAAVKPGQKELRPGSTYLGGTTEWAGATLIDVGPAQNLMLGNVKMLNETWVHVRGKVTGDPALIAGARVVRMTREPTTGSTWSYGADIQKDGSFDMANMWSSRFTIAVLNQRNEYLGSTPIAIGHDHLENVVIDASAAPFSGAVRMEGVEAAAPAARAGGAPLGQVVLTNFEGPSVVRAAARVNPDGFFTIPHLGPGKYVADVTGLPPGSYLKALRLGGADALDQGLYWGPNDVRTLEAVISAKAAVLEGVAQDEDGKPAPGSMITLIPVPPRFGHARLYPSVTADQQGRFRFLSVTPGVYKVYAWEQIDDTGHWDTDYIRPFEGQGERVELEEGGHGTATPKRISAAVMQEALRKAGQ
jgi:protocatechuate 3,4-dioxygenase beta subunit